MKFFRYSRPRGAQNFFSLALAFFFATTTLAACAGSSSSPSQSGDIHKIQHVVVIMQENRSFDSYFGTFPGADGLPRDSHGNFTTCVPDPRAGHCAAPYHDSSLTNAGGPHYKNSAQDDINGGQMDGFV